MRLSRVDRRERERLGRLQLRCAVWPLTLACQPRDQVSHLAVARDTGASMSSVWRPTADASAAASPASRRTPATSDAAASGWTPPGASGRARWTADSAPAAAGSTCRQHQDLQLLQAIAACEQHQQREQTEDDDVRQ